MHRADRDLVHAFARDAEGELASGSLLGRVLTGAKGRLITTLASSTVIALLAFSLVL